MEKRSKDMIIHGILGGLNNFSSAIWYEIGGLNNSSSQIWWEVKEIKKMDKIRQINAGDEKKDFTNLEVRGR